ncbi:MAG TPA: DUF1360 domain-containing protein [Gaiellaceae bacterium]|nr:DUF1360 domain-containing protein [Gaiellaceae bacterium]
MDERPLPEYATLTAAFWAVFLGFVLTNRDRLPERIPFGDLARIALSSYKISRVITTEEVTAFVRAPVTEDAEAQQPKREGAARVLGELLTCPYCVGLWVASTISFGLVRFPRETRFATTIFGAYALSDFLHAGFVRLRGSSE